jgi:hypothetical protein
MNNLPNECQRELMVLTREFFTPEELMSYKTYLTYQYPEEELPEKVRKYNILTREILAKYGKDQVYT